MFQLQLNALYLFDIDFKINMEVYDIWIEVILLFILEDTKVIQNLNVFSKILILNIVRAPQFRIDSRSAILTNMVVVDGLPNHFMVIVTPSEGKQNHSS